MAPQGVAHLGRLAAAVEAPGTGLPEPVGELAGLLLERTANLDEKIEDRISKMGQRDLRRLLIIGAMAVVRHAIRCGGTADPWLANMLERKPRMLVAVALANRMARVAWAVMRNKEAYRARATA